MSIATVDTPTTTPVSDNGLPVGGYGSDMTNSADKRRREQAEAALLSALDALDEAERAAAEARAERDRAVHRLARAMGYPSERGVPPEIARLTDGRMSGSLVKHTLTRPEPQ